MSDNWKIFPKVQDNIFKLELQLPWICIITKSVIYLIDSLILRKH